MIDLTIISEGLLFAIHFVQAIKDPRFAAWMVDVLEKNKDAILALAYLLLMLEHI